MCVSGRCSVMTGMWKMSLSYKSLTRDNYEIAKICTSQSWRLDPDVNMETFPLNCEIWHLSKTFKAEWPLWIISQSNRCSKDSSHWRRTSSCSYFWLTMTNHHNTKKISLRLRRSVCLGAHPLWGTSSWRGLNRITLAYNPSRWDGRLH